MARVTFTANLQRHVAAPPGDFAGETVGEVLTHAFAADDKLRGYIVDEHGALRKHMLVFVNGVRIQDREKLSDPVPADAEIHVFQALSGG